MLNCQEASRLLSEAQERDLSLKERMSLRMHTLMCVGCRNFSQQMWVLRRLSRSYAKDKQADVDATDLPD